MGQNKGCLNIQKKESPPGSCQWGEGTSGGDKESIFIRNYVIRGGSEHVVFCLAVRGGKPKNEFKKTLVTPRGIT